MAATKGRTAEGNDNFRPAIAICGIRGIPGRYGGFETFAEVLAERLIKLGFDVTVYCRSRYAEEGVKKFKGAKLVVLPAPRHKYFETPIHTLLCFLHLLLHRADAVLVCNAANSPFLWVLRAARIPVAVNVDGIERLRTKWNRLGRAWYSLGERCSVRWADKLVSDAKVISDYYIERYQAASTVIPYGYDSSLEESVKAKIEGGNIANALQSEAAFFNGYGIEAGKYLLYVSRLEPENNALLVIEAFNGISGPRLPLVVVGDAPYAHDYIRRLKEAAGPDVIFTGFQFGERYRLLQLGAYAYVQATEVGGTHPAFVEAMGFGNCIIANGTPENVETGGEAALYYPKNDTGGLRARLSEALGDARLVSDMRRKAFERAQKHYSWDAVTASYAQLFTELSGR